MATETYHRRRKRGPQRVLLDMEMTEVQLELNCCKSVGTDLSMLDIESFICEISLLKKQVASLEEKLRKWERKQYMKVGKHQQGCQITDFKDSELSLTLLCYTDPQTVNDDEEQMKNCFVELEDCRSMIQVIQEVSTDAEERIEIDVKEEMVEEGDDDGPKQIKSDDEDYVPPDSLLLSDRMNPCSGGESASAFTEWKVNRFLRKKARKKNYHCDLCDKGFDRPSALIAHSKKHTREYQPESSYCEDDDAVDDNEEDGSEQNEKDGFIPSGWPNPCFDGETVSAFTEPRVEQLTRKKVRKKNHHCDLCEKSFDRPSALIAHRKRHTGENQFDCSECKMSFIKRSQLKEHSYVHAREKAFQCSECGKGFDCSKFLQFHMRLHGEVNKPEKKLFSCGLCKESFEELDALRSHDKTHTEHQSSLDTNQPENHERGHGVGNPNDEESCHCSDCIKARSTHHEVLHSKEKRFKCSVCSKAFHRSKFLEVHKQTHSEETPHKCSYCDQSYRTIQSRRLHEVFYCKKNPNKRQAPPKKHLNQQCMCSMCGKTFNDNRALKSHSTVHTGERPYPCAYCDKRYRTASHRIDHQRTHTGEKPYLCSYCGKTFRRQNAFTCHQRSHTGERPYKCQICGKGFSYRDSVKAHLIVHTRERAFKCSYCDKTFSQAGSARIHERIHTGEKIYHCVTCRESFAYRRGLEAHQKKHHAPESPS